MIDTSLLCTEAAWWLQFQSIYVGLVYAAGGACAAHTGTGKAGSDVVAIKLHHNSMPMAKPHLGVLDDEGTRIFHLAQEKHHWLTSGVRIVVPDTGIINY
jgi:hypothetical protein